MQRRARQSRRAFVQVGEIEQVGEDEVAVEANEGAEIQRQRRHPTGRRQVKESSVQQAGISSPTVSPAPAVPTAGTTS